MSSYDGQDHEFVHLAVNVLSEGTLPQAWLGERGVGADIVAPDFWESVARSAEEGGLDALFLADHSYLIDPTHGVLLSPLDVSLVWARVAAVTERIGLVTTASTTYNDPVEIAERIASLHYVSGGRATWNAVTSFGDGAAGNYGLDDILDRSDRYARAEEFIAVVRAVWDSAASGEAYRRHGQWFDVDGLSDVALPAGGLPGIYQAGGSAEGKGLAGRTASGVFSAAASVEDGRRNRSEVRAHARDTGRDPDDVLILPGLSLTLADTEAEARARVDEFYDRAAIDPGEGLLSLFFGTDDAADIDLDRPFPPSVLESAAGERFRGSVGFRDALLTQINAGSLTVREFLRQTRYTGSGHATFVGTPEQLVDRIEAWFRGGAADGFVLMPGVVVDELEILAAEVIPRLRARGLSA
ncbi:NtaA/DmoA family FMN-dependent monooxygenase [Gordonia soli]|uniref:Putative FMNH2-dependent monooxygenase n=1 Tax=Gordonia soli NBRC 108243 TaxID=1223545 RepID=M0QHR5_9ACTN|nr:NtaA/DmoA family FMN-dependent monooxygenase [Gordonia soli]GAC67836.1 putative FMNH2-dependent monooxygenase [Gordonia soli NBRC 108243]